MNGKKYSYNRYFSLVYIFIVILYVSFIFCWLFASMRVVELVLGETENPISAILQIIGYPIWSIFAWRAFSIGFNLYSDVIIEEEGIQVRLFNFVLFWRSISWDQIEEIWDSHRKYEGYDDVLISTSAKLTIWHRYLSKKWGNGKGNQIVLRETMIDRDELLSRIELSTGKRRIS